MSEIANYRKREANLALSKKLTILVWVLTVAVLGLVALMRSVKIPIPDGVDLSALPALHAFLNTLAALFLVGAIWAIKKGKVNLHRQMIHFAVVCSFVFLLSYVTYHFTTPATIYGDSDGNGILSESEKVVAGSFRLFYLFILLTHIVLAAVSFPFILLALTYAITNQFDKHKKVTRWVFPVWLYVAITGPLVYLLLRPYY
jgi:putative membrane protein